MGRYLRGLPEIIGRNRQIIENEGIAFGNLFKMICVANTLILNSQFIEAMRLKGILWTEHY